MLPNFIVIGAAKAATTALYWYLTEHPQIFMSPLKETNFFAYGVDSSGQLLYGNPELHRFPVRTLPEYEKLFAEAGDAEAVGEASPLYLECPDAALRIKALLPETRIVCALRHPVDRAYSDYLMYLRNRGQRFDPEHELTPDAIWAQPDSHWMRIGKYHEQLSRYFDIFPRHQIHIFLFDDLKQHPHEVVQDIYQFLCLDTAFIPDFDTPRNVGGLPKSIALERLITSRHIRAVVEPWIPQQMANWVRRMRTSNFKAAPPLSDELRKALTHHFEDDIARTAELIERGLDDWLRGAR